MAISFVDKGTLSVATGNPAPVYPAGIQTGDFILVLCWSSGLTSPSATDFTQMTESENTSSNLQMLYKIAAGTETGTLAVTQSGSNFKMAQILVWRGVNTSTPFEGFASATPGATATTAFPNVTTTGANRWLVYASGKDRLATTPTTPVGYTTREAVGDATSTDGTIHCFDQLIATAQTVTGPTVSYGADTNEWVAQGFALIPASAGSSDTPLIVTSASGVGEGSVVNLINTSAAVLTVGHAQGCGEGQEVLFSIARPYEEAQGVGEGSDIVLTNFTGGITSGQGVGQGQTIGMPLVMGITFAQGVGQGSNVGMVAVIVVTSPSGRPRDRRRRNIGFGRFNRG
jgi:hypothetical protein